MECLKDVTGRWLDVGPLTANYEECASNPAELLYGGNLRPPSDSVLNVRPGLNTTGLLHLLRDALRKMKLPAPANHTKNLADLDSCVPVLIRTDASVVTSRKSLRSPLFKPRRRKYLQESLPGFAKGSATKKAAYKVSTLNCSNSAEMSNHLRSFGVSSNPCCSRRLTENGYLDTFRAL